MQAHLSTILTTEQLIFADILEVDMDTLAQDKQLDPEKTFVVGNLPYYITSPILRKFFGDKGVHCA
jgi:16S rRNA (adenine1518-N6/adenine1519-N6)-dimethyltransferase